MKISIITATYNSAVTVEDTLKSVAGQTHSDVEHIIVDGASTDDTLEITRSYPHVSKIISEPDKGIYDAMNKGIGLATGNLIGILNSDDFYANVEVLEKVACHIGDADTLYADLNYVHPLNTTKVERHWKAGKYSSRSFLYGWMPPHPTFFVRPEVYKRYGAFNLALRSAADYELMLRFLYRHEVSSAYLPEVIVKMRSGGVSNASLRHRMRANREDSRAWAINGLHPLPFTMLLKPMRKIGQWRW